jgi:glycosyltransferase involved in cell wall biosynthesis
MRVLMLNAFHWLKGGVERTVFDETAWLERAGHEVAHFATRDARNLPSPFSDHFAPAADYSETTPARRQLGQLPRAIWSAPAERALAGLLAAWRPDVAHVHAPSRYLTPSVIAGLERARVPVVMTLHDFKPWCTNRLLYARGAPCVRCNGGKHWHAVAVGCVQHSRLKSLVGALEAYDHDRRGAYRPVRRWIAPSRFVREQSVALGADAACVRVLAHGVEAAAPATSGVPDLPERFVLYAGRLSEEKGVRSLPVLARSIAPVPLVVVGGGPLVGWLAEQRVHSVHVLGHLGTHALAAVRARATAVVVPSLFPETFGYAVAEAQLDARPVIASRIGALAELVEHDASGLLVPPGDEAALIAAVRRTLAEPERARRWGDTARDRARSAFDPATHARGLVAIYEEAIAG